MFRAIIWLVFHRFAEWILADELNDNEKRRQRNWELLHEIADLKQKQRIVDDFLDNVCNRVQSVETLHAINYIAITKHREPVIIQLLGQIDSFQMSCFALDKHYNANAKLSCCLGKNFPQSTSYYHVASILQHVNIIVLQDDTLIITDINTDKDSLRQGYATTLILALFRLAKQHSFKTIIGEIATVDRDEWKNLEIFYQSLGFETYIVPDLECGAIIKHLE